MAPPNLHVALKFLGGVDEARLPEVEAAVAAAASGYGAFPLPIRGLGAFPSATRPRVIWAGAPAEALVPLAAAVDARLVRLGFPAEGRAFAAHVTLGRVREPRRDATLAGALAAGAAREFGTVAVDRVSLMRSDLSPRGARYTELRGFPLAGSAA